MEFAFAALAALCLLREYLMFRERQEWAAERRLLMMRVQSPDVAYRLDGNEVSADFPSVPSLPYDDDEAFHELRRELGDD